MANDMNNEAVFSSTLLQYIHQDNPNLMRKILSMMRVIIEREGNYDPNNASMIICDEKLERALNVKSCHIGQLMEILHKRLALPMHVQRSLIPAVPRTAHRRYPVRVSPYRAVVKNSNIHAGTKVILRPSFAELLNRMEGPHRNEMVFRWDQVVRLVSKYITENQDRIVDQRNPNVLNVRDDPMGQLFGVLSLHRNQIEDFIREQIIPYVFVAETLV